MLSVMYVLNVMYLPLVLRYLLILGTYKYRYILGIKVHINVFTLVYYNCSNNDDMFGAITLHIVKDVVVVFREAFHPSIHPSCHPSMDGIIQGRKPWQK
jgi:hypothetical protein